MNEDKFQQDAIQILDRLTLMPFEECFMLDKILCELLSVLEFMPSDIGVKGFSTSENP